MEHGVIDKDDVHNNNNNLRLSAGGHASHLCKRGSEPLGLHLELE